MENPEPTIVEKSVLEREKKLSLEELETFEEAQYNEAIDEQEIFEWLKNLKDPEYPLSLEELKVVDSSSINLDAAKKKVAVRFTPTVPHCSQATLIGLMLKCVLQWSLPRGWKISVSIEQGTHSSEASINKQLADKERVAAALENPKVLAMIVRGVLRTRTIDDIIQMNLRLQQEQEVSMHAGKVVLPQRRNAKSTKSFCPI